MHKDGTKYFQFRSFHLKFTPPKSHPIPIWPPSAPPISRSTQIPKSPLYPQISTSSPNGRQKPMDLRAQRRLVQRKGARTPITPTPIVSLPQLTLFQHILTRATDKFQEINRRCTQCGRSENQRKRVCTTTPLRTRACPERSCGWSFGFFASIYNVRVVDIELRGFLDFLLILWC